MGHVGIADGFGGIDVRGVSMTPGVGEGQEVRGSHQRQAANQPV